MSPKGVLIATLLALPGMASAQNAPNWVSVTPVISEDGFASLQWSVDGDQSIPVFRIHEQAPAEQRYIFTDQVDIRLFRNLPGDYQFRIQACIRSSSDHPRCGPPSRPLTLIVQGTALTAPAAAQNAAKTSGAGAAGEVSPGHAPEKSQPRSFTETRH